MDFSLTEIRDLIKNCSDCRLRDTTIMPVPGYGPPDAKIMVIGEAPGFFEEKQGKPFVGTSGNLLRDLFKEIGIDPQKIFYANVINCRPPGNRDPMQGELDTCKKWVDLEISNVKPRVIVTAGRFSMRLFFPTGNITSNHGVARFDGDKVYFASFHPAAALHDPSKKDAIQKDFQKLKKILQDLNILN